MNKARFKPAWNSRDRGRRAPNAPTISDEMWEAHRATIEQLYLDRDMKLDDVMDTMRVYQEFSRAS